MRKISKWRIREEKIRSTKGAKEGERFDFNLNSGKVGGRKLSTSQQLLPILKANNTRILRAKSSNYQNWNLNFAREQLPAR